MRKKLFAILMSAMMMVTFMPAMAFATAPQDPFHADGHTAYSDAVNDELSYDWKTGEYSVNWEVIENVIEDADFFDNLLERLGFNPIKVNKKPTHDEAGSVTLKCKKDGCDETVTAKIPALGCRGSEWKSVTMTVEQYVAKRAEQKGWNAAKKAEKLAEYSNVYCKVVTEQCTCGKVGHIDSANSQRHEAASNAPACASTYKCTKCQATVQQNGTHSFDIANEDALKALKLAGNITSYTLVPAKCSQGKDSYVVVCAACGEEVVGSFAAPTCADPCVPDVAPLTKVIEKTVTNGTDFYTEDDVKVGEYRDGTYTAEDGFYVDQTTTVKWYRGTTVVKAGYKVAAEDINTGCDETNTVAVCCKYCGKQMGNAATVANNVKGHTWVKANEKAATCKTQHDMYNYVCSVCGMYARTNHKKFEHDATNVINGATRSLSHATTYLKNVDTPVAHAYTVKKVAATCTCPAYYVIECAACEDAFTVDAFAFSGKVSLWLDAKSGDIDTEKNADHTVELAVLDGKYTPHKYTTQKTLKAATCTTDEVVGYACDVCGKVCMHGDYEPTTVANTATGHTATKTVVAPSCEKLGYTMTYCAKCDSYKVSDLAKKLVIDTFDLVSVEAIESVSEYGITIDANGDIFVKAQYADIIASLVNVVLPSAEYTAKAVLFGDNYVAPLGGTCDMAGDMKVVKAATIFEEGIKASTCSKCGQINEKAHTITIAKKAYKAPKVKAGKKYVKVTVKAQTGAVSYKIYVGGKCKKTVTAAGTYKIKKLTKGTKKVKIVAYNAGGLKATSKVAKAKVK